MHPLRNVDSPNKRGAMSEWTVAFGLALKATQEHFANRDGKRRDPNAPREVVQSMAEVVDLNAAPVAVAASDGPKEPEVLRA